MDWQGCGPRSLMNGFHFLLRSLNLPDDGRADGARACGALAARARDARLRHRPRSAARRRSACSNRTSFKPDPQAELELADKTVWLDDVLILSQVKERNAPPETTTDNERKWFEDEVVRKSDAPSP